MFNSFEMQSEKMLQNSLRDFHSRLSIDAVKVHVNLRMHRIYYYHWEGKEMKID